MVYGGIRLLKLDTISVTNCGQTTAIGVSNQEEARVMCTAVGGGGFHVCYCPGESKHKESAETIH